MSKKERNASRIVFFVCVSIYINYYKPSDRRVGKRKPSRCRSSMFN